MNLFINVLLVITHFSSFTLASQNNIHFSLSKEELRRIFNVDTHDKVPSYDVVHLRSRTKRDAASSHASSDHTVHLSAFGTHHILNLKPNVQLARHVPIFYADSHNKGSGVFFTPVSHTSDIGIPYQDESSMAAVMISKHPDTGRLMLDGTIGQELVVKSLPPSLHHMIPLPTRRKRPREDEISENELKEASEEEAYLDEDDLLFSDGLPLVPDDEPVRGGGLFAKSDSKNNTKHDLPEGLMLLRKRRSTDYTREGVHIVYKRAPVQSESDFALMEMEESESDTHRSGRSKREAPYVIYPEILVLVDYDGYLLHGEDNSQIKSYYVSFWNGVDLRYKLLKSPKVKISIAGIIISRSRDAMPYLERNRVGRDAIDSASALTDMGKYLYQERRLPTYDIAVAITKYDLCRRRKSGNCTTGTAGFAYVGGACVVNKRLEKVNSVAIVEDTGGFSGIIVAAHEVGHLLGAVHDGSPPPSYLGGPGARSCKWKDGYIMSDLRHTERGFRWSPCSTEQFHHFLNGETATCLYNLPHEDESLPRVLPGKLLSLDAQCRKDRGTSACFKDDRVCAQLFCFDSSSGFCVSYRPAAEGSDCGSGKICLNGKCVYDDENSISDIDIHSPTDNFLYDSTKSKVVVSQTTTTTTTMAPKTTRTTRKPRKPTRRSWWKNNNRWNKNKHSQTTTRSPINIWNKNKQTQTTKQPPTSWPRLTTFVPPKTTRKTTTTKTTTPRTTTTTTTTSTTTTTPPPTTTTTTTTTPPPTTTTTTSTTTTTPKPSTTTYRSTTRWSTKFIKPTTYRTTTRTSHSPLKSKDVQKPFNSLSSHDSNCEDKIDNIAGSLTCKEFLKSYGFRYCNHRYIEKNCCRAKEEICSKLTQ